GPGKRRCIGGAMAVGMCLAHLFERGLVSSRICRRVGLVVYVVPHCTEGVIPRETCIRGWHKAGALSRRGGEGEAHQASPEKQTTSRRASSERCGHGGSRLVVHPGPGAAVDSPPGTCSTRRDFVRTCRDPSGDRAISLEQIAQSHGEAQIWRHSAP